MEQNEITKIIEKVVFQTLKEYHNIPIAASNRHIHLSPTDVERLFGKGYELKKIKNLSQPGQFACEETVTLIGPKGKIEKVRVLGPARGDTQVEVSLYDGYTLGVKPPIRNSGDIKGTAPITIQGPKGQIMIEEGLICAARHIHMHPDDAKFYNVKDGQRVQVETNGERGLIFNNVLIRVSPKYSLEMHIDIDEANAAQITNGEMGRIIRS